MLSPSTAAGLIPSRAEIRASSAGSERCAANRIAVCRVSRAGLPPHQLESDSNRKRKVDNPLFHLCGTTPVWPTASANARRFPSLLVCRADAAPHNARWNLRRRRRQVVKIPGAIQSDAITLRLFVIWVAGSDLLLAIGFCRTWPNRSSSRRFYD